MSVDDSVISWRYHIEGSDNFDSAGTASQLTKSRFKQLGLSDELIRKVVISMYEGEINMVIHANGGEALVEMYPTHIVVTLTDTGNGIANIDEAMKEGYSTATEEIRNLGFGAGMGLPNMKKYSDSLTIESVVGQGTTVRLSYNI